MGRKPSEAITDNMRAVLDFIRDCYAADRASTLRNIADHMGWSSTSTARGVVNSLRSRKLLHRKKYARKVKPAPEVGA